MVAKPTKTTKTTKRKRKRRKKKGGGRYHTGLHSSPKCRNSPMKYRSGWELTVAKHLDSDPLVDFYEYESIKIPYISNVRRGTLRNYLPDFLVTYTDGRKVMVEVKRTSALNQVTVQKKAAAARVWAVKNQAEYTFWTDPIIKALQKIEKAKKL